MEKLEVLSGHTSQETAYVVDDYPYGFVLRCKIRFWLEYKRGHGFRLVSQTTNPKRTDAEVWNKPKASVYNLLGVMGLNSEGHVTWEGCSAYDFDKLAEFEAVYGEHFDETQRGVCKAARLAYERYQARKASQAVAQSQPNVANLLGLE